MGYLDRIVYSELKIVATFHQCIGLCSRDMDLVEWRARTYSWKSIVPLLSLSNIRKMDSARKTASSPNAV